MTKIGKKVAALLLVVAMGVTFIPILGTQTVYAIDPTAEPIADDAYGTTGTCIWRLVSTGAGSPITMYVAAENSVEGGMADYSYDNLPPWYKYRDQIEEIEFVGVTHVGDYAFYNCSKLPDVYIFDAKRIGDHAFYGCPALTNITIDGHEDGCVIEKCAFGESMDYDNKSGFGKIDLANVTSIGDSAFEECDAEVDLGDKLQFIDEYAFAHNCKLEEIMIPRGCTQICRSAFYNDQKLAKAYVSDAKCTIGEYAFDEDVVLYCKKSSAALSYAKDNGYWYRLTGNMGSYTLDLRKGDVVLSLSDREGPAYPLYCGLELMAYCNSIYGLKEAAQIVYDLDKNGKNDLLYLYPDHDNNITMTKDTGYSVKDRITVKLPAAMVKDYEDRDEFYSSITVIFDKYANPLKISGKTATVKYSKLKKKAQTLAVTKVIKFTKDAKDKKTYTISSAKKGKKSFKKYFKINKTTGKVTIKKGLKKGTYKVKVKVKALGNNDYYASGDKTVTFTVKVK
ncbi:MAG: leucine-rich repeat domain-containing protein [Mogibacterium sp.]|nr:leucine-rich repeat domain-containing protein [Mogibacterium sp.]